MKKKIQIIITCLLFFFITSILSIYSASNINNLENLYIKQIIYYFLGIILLLFAYNYKSYISKYSKIIYFTNLFLLAIVLLFGIKINGSKCWLILGPFSFQPSEFMKIVLVFIIANLFEKYKRKRKFKDEFIMIIKLLFYISIPSILIFLEPDTGIIIIFFIITLAMIIYRGLNKKWIFFLSSIMLFLIICGLTIYYTRIDLIEKMLSSNFFYRLDRLTNWHSGQGYQLENSLTTIASAGLLGFGFNNNPLYFPEATTDFIFTTISSNTGFIGSIIFIITTIIFDINILIMCNKKTNKYNQYLIIGFVSMLFYQQIQNISMTIGLLPITGITLPFISYGGTSLLSYMFILGIILRIKRDNKRYLN